MRRMMTLGLLVVLMSILISGCASPAPANTSVAAPTAVPPTATAAANATAAPTAASPGDPKPASGALRFVTVAGANEARYRVREQLANRDLPSDAIGATKDVSGTLMVDAGGTVLAEQSRFVIGLASLSSDSGRRDGFVASNVLPVS